MAADDRFERITGEVLQVVFTSETTGFGVVEVRVDDEAETIRAAGPLGSLVPGQAVTLVGRHTEHPQHGPTFDTTYYEHATPRSTEGLALFLASERFPGVGATIATRLVEAFGLRLGDVLATAPERLAGIKGISLEQAGRIARAWKEAGALADLVGRLGEVGLPPAVARAVHRQLGDRALELLDSDPYALLAATGVGWSHVEALGRRAGIPADDPRRLRAGARAAVAGALGREGHTFVPAGEGVRAIGRLLGVDRAVARDAALAAEAQDLVVIDKAPLPDLPPQRLALPPAHAAEVGAAAHLVRLIGAGARRAGSRLDPGLAGLTATQADAVRAAFTHPVTVLTGGPGTDKTRTIQAVVDVCADNGLELALCAPTGRAAKRMEEMTGHAATTIHRLLEAQPDPDGGFVFLRDEHDPLPFDVVVADEWSMADVHLAHSLLRALETGTHLLVVGDADQLPPVGPGAALRDLIASDVVPVTCLVEIHRQAAESRIVTLAHEINAGTAPTPTGRDADVFAVPERRDRIADRVAAIVAERAPAFFDCDPSDVQVLAPVYRGPAGVDALNTRLKEELNPTAGRVTVAGVCEGDRVVATRNDAETGVANGDIGTVAAVDRTAGEVEVAFPQGMVTLTRDQALELAPAWCLTVHKSQGGEWPVVVLVLDGSASGMLTRELVYTAVTRASRGLLLVGDPSQVAAASRRAGSGLRARRTTLAARLAAALPSPPPPDGVATTSG